MKKFLSFFTMILLFGIINAQSIPQVVISGVYGGGGNSGAKYKNDYIELYNTTTADISLAGYALYYFAAASTTTSSANTFIFPAGATIDANGFLLIKASAGAGAQPEWPIAFDFDASGTGSNMNMKVDFGKVLLLSAPNGGSIPANILAEIQAMPNYVDFMPYGKDAIPVFGSSTKNLSSTTAASRKYNGTAITYTFDVGKDFNIVTADENAPRNSDYGATNRVAKPTFTPHGGIFNANVSVTISCATEGATIRYTLDGDDPVETSLEYSTAITVDKQTTIKAKAWKDEMEPSKIGSATFSYPQPVGSLAELRSLAPPYNGDNNKGTTVFKYTGQAVVTHVQNFQKTKYIQEGDAAIMIWDVDSNLQTVLYQGDLITNLYGSLINYFGMLRFIPIKEHCDALDMGYTVSPVKINASQLDRNYDNPIQAKVIIIDNISFKQTGNFGTGKYYDLVQNTVTYDSVFFTDKYEADYIGKPIPTIITSIRGVCNFKGTNLIPTKNRIVMLDYSNSVVGINDFNASTIKLSPNPANSFVNIITGVDMTLEIYSMLGNLVATNRLNEGENIISVSNYPAGVYIMKMIDVSNGQTHIQKLVVK